MWPSLTAVSGALRETRGPPRGRPGLQALRVSSQRLGPPATRTPDAPASHCPPASPAPQQPLCCSDRNQSSWEVAKVRPQSTAPQPCREYTGPSWSQHARVCACVCAQVHRSTQARKQRQASRSCESCRIGQRGGALSEGPRDAPGGLRAFGADAGRAPGKHRPQQLVESPDRQLEWQLPTLAAAAAESRQSCPTLCDPIDGGPPGSRPWDSPGKHTGVGCHFLLTCMKVKRESEVAQSCQTLKSR